MTTLLQLASRQADAFADQHGVARTAVPGLSLIRETMPGVLQYAINRPLVALVLQGRKSVSVGGYRLEFGAGESLVVAADVPTVSQITAASAGKPYVSVVIDLDPAVIERLVLEMGPAPFAAGSPVRVEATDLEVADAVLRLLRLHDRPAQRAVLEPQLLRELHYWMLCGRHGGAIRSLGVTGGHVHRIGRAIALMRSDIARPLRVRELADAAGMSISGFHARFRTLTSLTPIQFQKHLRLIEAQRLMLREGAAIGTAAHAVGYESVPHFTRDFGRLFGEPPGRHLQAVRARSRPAA